MLFDFEAYLRELDPSQHYTITQLTGGIVNITIRATKQNILRDDGSRFPNHASLILKHATPFVAGVGEQVPLSQTRQDIEFKALSLLSPGGLLGDLQVIANIKIPTPLYYDMKDHILVLSDLGHLPNLSSVFGTLGGWTPSETPPSLYTAINEDQDAGSVARDMEYYSSIGSRLGEFFARIHSRSVLQAVIGKMGSSYLEDTSVQKGVREYWINSIHSHLYRFTDLIDHHVGFEILYQRIEKDWSRPTMHDEQSFIHGDAWTGSVLVTDPPSRRSYVPISEDNTQSNNTAVCLIDFEFSTIGRGPHGNVAQFLAHLECFLLVARYHKSANEIRALETLINGFVETYRSCSLEVKARWIARSTSTPRQLREQESLRLRIMRSALISMAAEMMNTIFWKVWPCREPLCPGVLANPSSNQDATGLDGGGKDSSYLPHDERLVQLCPLTRFMALNSIWIIQHAGNDETEFSSAQNWQALLEGPPNWYEAKQDQERRKWLLDLFI